MTSKFRSISPRIYVWGCLRVLNATVGKISENKNAIENVYYFHDEILSAVVACPQWWCCHHYHCLTFTSPSHQLFFLDVCRQ